jgi:CRP-like cAMP-binding protein
MLSKQAFIIATLNRPIEGHWFDTCHAKKDSVIISQGAPLDYLYILREGRIHQAVDTDGLALPGRWLKLRTIKSASMVGEGVLSEPSDTQFTAATDCMLYRIPKETFITHLDCNQVRARSLMLNKWVSE